MNTCKRDIVIGIFFVLITGTLAHFLYEWTGKNKIAGFFTPVNESVWEHMKLIFFPMLIYSLSVIPGLRSDVPCITSSLCSGILAGTFLIPALFYTYTALLGKDVFILDIGIFVLSTIAAFYLSLRLARSCRLRPYTLILCGCVCIVFVCFLLFSYNPPDSNIFEDPSISCFLFLTY